VLLACTLSHCGKTSSTAPAPEGVSQRSAPGQKPGARAVPSASALAAKPPSAPDAGPPAFPLLPEDCREPRVAAANAPLSALARSGWNWPWVTQSLLAYETRFVFEPSEVAAARRVTLHQREVKANEKVAGRAELIAACQTPGTCNELAKVLRVSIPGSQATPYCAAQPESGPSLPLAWGNLLPPLPPRYLAGRTDAALVAGPRDVEKECVRWAVCSHQQDPARPADVGLACLKDPNRYERERRCASGATCFDVAQCAGQNTRPGPELPLWREFDQESDHREAFWLAGRQLYSPGGGPLTPSMLYDQTARDSEIWHKQRSPGRWFIVATGYEATNPTDPADGDVAMQSTSGSWQLQYVTLDDTIFGPVQTVSGDGDEVRLAPGFHATLGHGGEELLFDYDADGLPEVGVYLHTWHHVMPPHVVLRVWTVKQGKIVPYAPADGLPAVGATDLDGDGRPDLLLDSKGEFTTPEGCVDTPEVNCPFESHSSLNPDSAAHALPNGTFSTKDAVAKQARD